MAKGLKSVVAQFKLAAETVDESQNVIETFKQAHLNWVKRAEVMLSGGTIIRSHELTSHTECALGRWYVGRGLGEWGHLPEFKAIEAPHREMHQLLVNIANARQRGQNINAKTALADLKQLSQQVVATLNKLELQIEHSPVKVLLQSSRIPEERKEIV
jgi:hypothetical protein